MNLTVGPLKSLKEKRRLLPPPSEPKTRLKLVAHKRNKPETGEGSHTQEFDPSNIKTQISDLVDRLIERVKVQATASEERENELSRMKRTSEAQLKEFMKMRKDLGDKEKEMAKKIKTMEEAFARQKDQIIEGAKAAATTSIMQARLRMVREA